MQTRLRPRKRFSPAEKRAILEAYRSSPLSQRDFIVGVGIGLSTLHAWLRKARSAESAGSASFVQIPNPLARSTASAASTAYRLEFPSGVVMDVRSGFDAGELGALVQMLQTV